MFDNLKVRQELFYFIFGMFKTIQKVRQNFRILESYVQPYLTDRPTIN